MKLIADIADSLGRGWRRVFFSPEPAVNLAAARILFSLHALWILFSRDLPALSGLPAEFWINVERGDLLRYLIFVGHPEIEYGIQCLAVAALISAALGFLPRASCFVSAVLLYHLAPLETIYWTANPYQRGFEISILSLFTLSFSRCGDALVPGARGNTPGAEYCWPIRLIQIYVAHAYFVSGYAKLYRVGFSWLDPENLRAWFLLFTQQEQVRRSGRIFEVVGPWIADSWALCLVASLFGVVANLLFGWVIFSRRARWFFIPDALFFHLMVFLTLSIFWLNLPQLLVFMNWHWISARLAGRDTADVRN